MTQAVTQIMIEATEIGMTLGAGAARVDALKGVNLSLAGGELTLLMGPSGSGKTTLLSVLGCMLSPTSGSVRIRGRWYRSRPQMRELIGELHAYAKQECVARDRHGDRHRFDRDGIGAEISRG